MRTMVFVAATAGALGFAAPAGAQTVYVDDGYRAGCCPTYGSSYSYRSYGYGDWDTARAEVYVGSPRARVYAYDDAPRYRARYYSRGWNDGYGAYAYSGNPYAYSGNPYAYSGGPYVRYRDRDYRRYDGPSVSVGFGGRHDRYDYDYGYRSRW